MYNIYLDYCEGLICPPWKVDNPVTYRKFREILSSHMLSYNLVQKRYPGDYNMRVVTKVVRTQQSGRVEEVTEKDFAVSKKKRRI